MVGDSSSIVGNGVKVSDAPILLLVTFHKALRAEFNQVCRIASSLDVSSPSRDLLLDLHHRFQFLKLAYKYHCAAEDEIIFQALDGRVANVACTYSLEHCGIEELFDSVFQSLDVLLEQDSNNWRQFRDLVDCTATIQTSICQHMVKEEEQVFPLLVHHFSVREQAALVWQFFCIVPIILLEDFLPWMTYSLPRDEQDDVVQCIKEVVPREKLLQEVVASWLGRKSQSSSICLDNFTNNEVASGSEKSLYLKKSYTVWSSAFKENCCKGELNCLQENAEYHPVDSLRLWHCAIRKDLKEVVEELCEMRNSKVFSNLASIAGQLKFILEVLIFYSDVLENVFFPVLSEFSDCRLSFSNKQFPKHRCIGLLCVLQNINFHSGTLLCVEQMYQHLGSLLEGINEHFSFQELEVFTLIRKHCNDDMQQRLLYLGLHMMPLGLLKCVITWLSTHLSEGESKAVLCNIKLAGSMLDMSFASLLYKWACLVYSGKTSQDAFKKELQEMFENKSYYLAKNIEETGFEDLHASVYERSLLVQVFPRSSGKAKKKSSDPSSYNTKEKNIAHSNEMNLQVFFPDFFKKVSPFSQNLTDKGDVGTSLQPDFKPIDYIFLFHKALSNDFNHLVLESTKLVENVTLFEEFCRRFHLVRFLYQIHSDNEDLIAFPSLEAKVQLQNISLSYTIDHKLAAEYFSRISGILDEISELHASLPSKLSNAVDGTLGQRIVKYRHLCMKLHGKCKTICSTVGKHFQREETELRPLFTKYFTDEEQDKIIGSILGNTRAEILQQTIPWLLACLSSGEQLAMMSLWRKTTKNTMFDEWLAEWWEGMSTDNVDSVEEKSTIFPWTLDTLEIVARYLSKESHGDFDESELHNKRLAFQPEESVGDDLKFYENSDGDDKRTLIGDIHTNHCAECHNKTFHKVTVQTNKKCELMSTSEKLRQLEEHILTMSEEDLTAAVRRVYNDPTLDLQKKSHISQTLLTSRWTVSQQKPHQEVLSSNDGGILGQCPSYRDPLTFGCKHYKRNCKVFASCCEKLFTCRYCHDDATDHVMDRKSATKMMCMKCLKIQPLSATCSSVSCKGLSMAKYFCKICRLYDDERIIYHCPYCNLCRLGKGLGFEYFHCMNCNACMAKSLAVHICREKGFESNCPICREDIFSSSSPVKALPCGHMMHSTCFQIYTSMHYTCPICSKSLGDMQVYYRMLDALLAEEKTPEEFYGRTQGILCNDCEKRGVSPFHWLYHKCSNCGSYNTRLL